MTKKVSKPKSIGKKPEKRKATEAMKATQFKAGNKLGGRPKGSRNKFGEEFLKDFLADWEVGGADAIRTTREIDPAAYLRVAASLLPKELNIKQDTAELEQLLEQYGIEELDNLIAGLTAVGVAQRSKADKVKEATGIKPDKLH